MTSWGDELDKLKERVEELSKKTSSNPDSLKQVGENIDSSLEEIKKYLEASEEIIAREAKEQPKTKASYDNLTGAVAKLEDEIKHLETQYKALETKTQGLKVKYAVGGAVAGLAAGVAAWAALSGVKKWLGTRQN